MVLPNGKIQITAATVSGGKVHMNVTDFSPFILLGTDSGQLLESDIKKIESGLISETGSSAAGAVYYVKFKRKK